MESLKNMFIALNLQKQKIIECTLKMFSGRVSHYRNQQQCANTNLGLVLFQKIKKIKNKKCLRSLCVDEK